MHCAQRRSSCTVSPPSLPLLPLLPEALQALPRLILVTLHQTPPSLPPADRRTEQQTADGKRVSIMQQVQREDIRLHLPRLRACDESLVAVMDRFNDSDLCIAWGKQEGGGDGNGQWWKEQPFIPTGKADMHLEKGLLECVTMVVSVLDSVRDINTDVIERMEVPESYAEGLPAGNSEAGSEEYGCHC